MSKSVQSRSQFSSVRTEGGLLPADLLQRLRGMDKNLIGMRAEDYQLLPSEKLNEAASRSWTRLLGAWRAFQEQVAMETRETALTQLTLDRWLLVLFNELDYGRMPKASPFEIDETVYAISHNYYKSPIHLVGCQVDLDKRIVGATTRSSPHSLVQEFLNRSTEHLWGFVSNGKVLRVLRDNVSLTRQAFVEFDLVAMFEGEAYADFLLLWLVCHQSRIEAEKPEECWLEQWSKLAQQEGTRALEQLSKSVETAISSLGAGFLASPANQKLREDLRQGTLSTQDYYRQLLRLVYRLLFLFVAEDRELLLKPDAGETEKDRYLQYYSTRRLRLLADQTRGTPHPDLYEGLKIVMNYLGQDGCEPLGLPVLGSFLWSRDAIPDLFQAQLSNQALLKAVFALAYTIDGKIRRSVDYKNLGSEELGSVYESLLELHPDIHTEAATFSLNVASGNERKTTGSYYTPSSLITCLLDSALDPVIAQATQGKNREQAEEALLNLKICDPACGSGHFLIAASHRLAKRLASIRTGDAEPAPTDTRHALRDVIGRCIYGVDINPISVELCKVSLWMEALEPGKPLSFLDHHIRCGNALIGATPELIEKGIPDEAFNAIEGDDKEICKAAKKANRDFYKSGGQLSIFDGGNQNYFHLGTLAPKIMELDLISDDSISGVQARESQYKDIMASGAFQLAKTTADAWCAAFVWRKVPDLPPITGQVFWQIKRNPHTLTSEPWRKAEIDSLAQQYQFFHWHLAFPEVFYRGKDEANNNGFDCILGNPPWKTIENLDFQNTNHSRIICSVQHFLSNSGAYPYSSSGRKNFYALFVEKSMVISKIESEGFIGLIVPTEICQGKETEHLIKYIIEKNKLKSLCDLQNNKMEKNELNSLSLNKIENKWFISVHPQLRFCLLTLSSNNNSAKFSFDTTHPQNLKLNDKGYYLSLEQILSFCSENSFRVPMFINPRDAYLMSNFYSKGLLLSEVKDLNSGLMFNFGSAEIELKKEFGVDSFYDDYLPVLEGEYVHQYDHKFALYSNQVNKTIVFEKSNKIDPDFKLSTKTYLPREFVLARQFKMFNNLLLNWFVVLRRQARANDSYISISSIVPPVAIEGSLSVFYGDKNLLVQLLWIFNTYVSNYILGLRQSGPNVNKGIYGLLPVLFLENEIFKSYLLNNILELTYTDWELQSFAQDFGYDGPPFKWDDDRRFLLRCELEAAYFHLYGIEREDVVYIMDTFPIVKGKDEKKYGDYRTKLVILNIYDAMKQAIETGTTYQTPLDPPPADPQCAHPVVSYQN